MALNDLDDVTREQVEYKALADYLIWLLSTWFPEKKRFRIAEVKKDLIKSIEDWEIKV